MVLLHYNYYKANEDKCPHLVYIYAFSMVIIFIPTIVISISVEYWSLIKKVMEKLSCCCCNKKENKNSP